MEITKMNNIFETKTPTESFAQVRRAEFDLSNQGIEAVRLAYWNLPTEALYEEAIFRGEGVTSAGGPLVANTGKHTARSASDKFVVRHVDSENNIWWGVYNRPFEGGKFDRLYDRLSEYLQGKDVFVQDVYAGADENYRLSARFITEQAWHSLFIRNMFILPQSLDEYKNFVPEFTIIAAPGFKADPAIDGTKSETFIILNFERKLAIIGNTAYAGETKKTVFTLLNYLLPLEGVLSMHCSANVNPKNEHDTALFFGLSGTGKTTLSADPRRRLIGDDEHGWSEEGVFNFEGGCHAKVLNLSPEGEPDIYRTTQMFGTILENVALDPSTKQVKFEDQSITENTRASYPLSYIPNFVADGRGGHPRNVIFLTADAFGVLPPIAKLSPEQAMYYFMSGYTAKVAGTERGVTEPQATFSACFGAVFLVWPPTKYAHMLGRLLKEHGSNVWLVNTGWSGGAYGVGKRMKLSYTRAMVNRSEER